MRTFGMNQTRCDWLERKGKKRKMCVDWIYGLSRETGRSSFTSSFVVYGSGWAGARKEVMEGLVSRRQHSAASTSARLTVGVISRTQVSSSQLSSFILSLMGSSKIGLSHVRSKSCLEYNAMTHGWSFSKRLRSFSPLSRPCISLVRASHSCH